MKKTAGMILGAALLTLMFISCSQKTTLTGAGATFPYPYYSKIFKEYHGKNKIQVNYQSIGSGGGIRQIKSETVDFGATDAFVKDSDLAEIKNSGSELLHIPTCLGAVVISYNLKGNPQLKFTAGIIADIFMGKITQWNDPAIKAVNPDVNLPADDIIPGHRSDGSGTTFIFSDYLSKANKAWKNQVGAGKSLKWPLGIGAKGNEGVTGFIKKTPGSIGYVNLNYAINNKLSIGLVQNKSGNFINPSLESVSAAADTQLPDDTRIRLTDTAAASGYPISGFTWIVFYKEQDYNKRTKMQAMELKKLLNWVVTEGQSYASDLLYAPLPASAVEQSKRIINTMTYKGASF